MAVVTLCSLPPPSFTLYIYSLVLYNFLVESTAALFSYWQPRRREGGHVWQLGENTEEKREIESRWSNEDPALAESEPHHKVFFFLEEEE